MSHGSILPVPCRLDDTDVVQASKGSLVFPFAGFSANLNNYREVFGPRFEGGRLLPVYWSNSLAVTITTTAVVIVLALLANMP